MKRIMQIVAIVTMLSVTTACVYYIASTEDQIRWGEYDAGYDDGIAHAIEDAIIWAVDVYNPEDPEASAWGEYGQRIYIELDGMVYEHRM